ncbi:hypothetical protein [Azospirillum sp. sgz302134]
MLAIRTLGFSLILFALMLDHYATWMARWIGANTEAYAFAMALEAMSPATAKMTGAVVYPVVMGPVALLGMSLFVGGLLYPWLERGVLGSVSNAWARLSRRRNAVAV